MDFLIDLIDSEPSLFIGILGILLFAISIILYIYLNIYLKDISKIIFNNEKRHRRPLEPFNFISMSYLPTTFWREILHIRYEISFKKLYGKEFYYSINRKQLIELLENYKAYFILQYMIFFSVTLGIIFVTSCYVVAKYF